MDFQVDGEVVHMPAAALNSCGPAGLRACCDADAPVPLHLPRNGVDILSVGERRFDSNAAGLRHLGAALEVCTAECSRTTCVRFYAELPHARTHA